MSKLRVRRQKIDSPRKATFENWTALGWSRRAHVLDEIVSPSPFQDRLCDNNNGDGCAGRLKPSQACDRCATTCACLVRADPPARLVQSYVTRQDPSAKTLRLVPCMHAGQEHLHHCGNGQPIPISSMAICGLLFCHRKLMRSLIFPYSSTRCAQFTPG